MRYRLLFETAREGVWLLEAPDGRIVDANPFLCELLGLRRDQLVGRIPWELDLFVDPATAKARFERLLERGFSFDPEIAMKSASRGEVQIEAVNNVYTVGLG